MAVTFHQIDRPRGSVARPTAPMSQPANKMVAVCGAIAVQRGRVCHGSSRPQCKSQRNAGDNDDKALRNRDDDVKQLSNKLRSFILVYAAARLPLRHEGLLDGYSPSPARSP
jgi:hypothetical protein